VPESVDAEFTAFVAERSHALYRVAYTLTGDRHGAEDLLQIALTRLALAWHRVNGDPEAYLRRILYREHVSLWRRMWRRRELSVAEVPEGLAYPDPAGDSVQRHVLRDALLALPPRQRAVLVLRYLEDRSETEVAEILGCTTGTVGSQASRALAKLRRHLSATELTELML